MDAAQLLFTLQADGFHVSLTGENIAISPVSKLSDALKADIRAHKLELVSLLAVGAGGDSGESLMRAYHALIAMPNDRPPRWLTLLAPRCDLIAASDILTHQFGSDRVLRVIKHGGAP